MTTFYAADDGHNEPTIWAKDQITLEPFAQGDIAVLRRCDLAPDRRRFWPELVERVTGVGLYADLIRVGNGKEVEAAPAYESQVGWRYDGSCRDCQANLDTNGGQHQFWCGTLEGKAQWPADDWEIR